MGTQNHPVLGVVGSWWSVKRVGEQIEMSTWEDSLDMSMSSSFEFALDETHDSTSGNH